jgi:hypothetical protein
VLVGPSSATMRDGRLDELEFMGEV